MVLEYDMYFSKFKQFDTYLEFNEQNGCELYSEMKYMIEFCNVSFRYPGQEQYALKNINLEMSSGEKICIVGENGAGKTTLLKLLLRLYHTNEGEIRLNGVNIQKIRYEDYMKIFAVLFQDFQLFSDSVRNNIILNDTASSGGKELLRNKSLHLTCLSPQMPRCHQSSMPASAPSSALPL